MNSVGAYEMQELALATLGDAFKEATRFLLMATAGVWANSGYFQTHAPSAYLFIAGSSLEHFVQGFGVDADAQRLRETFFEWVTWRRMHRK